MMRSLMRHAIHLDHDVAADAADRLALIRARPRKSSWRAWSQLQSQLGIEFMGRITWTGTFGDVTSSLPAMAATATQAVEAGCNSGSGGRMQFHKPLRVYPQIIRETICCFHKIAQKNCLSSN